MTRGGGFHQPIDHHKTQYIVKAINSIIVETNPHSVLTVQCAETVGRRERNTCLFLLFQISITNSFPSLLWHCLLGNKKSCKNVRCWFVGGDDL